MANKQEVLSALKETGVIAVIRTENPGDLIEVAKALYKGGVKFIEITMTVPGAMEIIRDANEMLKNDDVYIGAGTVLDAETARAAILAGADYIVGPLLNIPTVQLCNRYSVAVMPGAITPLEILNAWQAGADVVKIFPAGVGGPGFFKDIKGPLPQVELMPTGSVDFQTAPEFIKAGACAVGVGGALVGKKLIADRDFETITKNAAKFIDIVQKAKNS